MDYEYDDYEYDVFISYRRRGEWPQWVKEKFLPLFDHWLGEELGYDCRIYIDQNMETGISWPFDLAYALSHSKVLVPLWSKGYFHSAWCKAELAHMLAREEKCHLRTPIMPGGLIIPAIIYDCEGEDRPHCISHITSLGIQDCTNVRMAPGSATEEELSLKIRNWVPSVANAIRSAPPYNPEWVKLTADKFLKLFEFPEPQQIQLPSLR